MTSEDAWEAQVAASALALLLQEDFTAAAAALAQADDDGADMHLVSVFLLGFAAGAFQHDLSVETFITTYQELARRYAKER